MKKKINYFITSIFTFLLFITITFAESFDVSVTSNTLTKGSTGTININASGLVGRFDISSSNSSVVSVSSGSEWLENNSKSITVYANAAGTAVITITPNKISTTDENPRDVSLNPKTITITVNEPAKPSNNNNNNNTGGGNNYTYKKSSNSYLTSITIDNYEITPKFDKEITEYTATIKAETEKIKINAQLADSNAKVAGTGEVAVSTGLNTFELIVTAENGSKRTYTIKVTVEESSPIKVKVKGEEYTVIKKRKSLPKISEYFEEKDINISGNTIEGYYNPTLKYDVIGLKDATGKIDFFIYKNKNYELYNECTFNGTTIRILDEEILNGKKSSFIYNSKKIESYQEVTHDIIKNTYALDNNDIVGNQFYLFYGINLETGKKYLYQYDALEKTVQRYNTLVLDIYKEQSDTYYMYLLYSILLLGIVIIIFSIILIKRNKTKKYKVIEEPKYEEEPIPVKKNIAEEIKEELESNNEEEILEEPSLDDIPIKKEIKRNKKKKSK